MRKINGTVLTMAVALGGCAVTHVKQVNEVPISTGHTRYEVPLDLITPQEVAARYATALKGATGFHLFDNNFEAATGVKIGVVDTSTVQVGYLNRTPNNRHDLVADFDIKQSVSGSNAVIDVTCPTTVRDDRDFYGLGLGEMGTLIPLPQAVADLKGMCARAELKVLQQDSGELNVGYPDAAVYANFSRKLSAYSWATTDTVKRDDIEKFKWFTVNDGRVAKRLGVAVYPYRSGSKITYRWSATLHFHGNGSSDFDPAAIERMRKLIAAIAND